MKKQQSGFTLIELIIVVVILGILAVTAAPRFLDLTDEANTAARAGVQGAIQAAADTARAQFLVTNGADADTATTGTQVSVDGTFVTVDNDDAFADGYPTADVAGIGNAVTLSSQWSTGLGANGFLFVAGTSTALSAANNGSQCVQYALDANDSPTTTVGEFTFGASNASTCAVP